MAITGVSEDHVEEAALECFAQLGFEYQYGPDIAPDAEGERERQTFEEVVLRGRLQTALEHLNPNATPAAIESAVRKVLVPDTPSQVQNNRRMHRMLVDGVEVEVARDGGQVRGELLRLVDFADVDANDFLVVNQFTVKDGQYTRRPDMVVFLNGIPVAVIELKNAADENATIWSAFNQLQTYKAQVPALFVYNALLVVSDGLEARLGSLTADKERFAPWRTEDGAVEAPKSSLEMEVLLKGVFQKNTLLEYLRHFIVFEEDHGELSKKIAGYHQFYAVQRAVEATVQAASPKGDRRGGVVWHTQGSGKSLTMTFYAGKVVVHPAMQNPTLLIITDRNDLDDQLFGTFARCHELLRQKPVQANSRDHLRDLLKVASGGVVFTTIQKFLPADKGEKFPVLSDRANIVVIADEAHRSQYGFKSKFNAQGQLAVGFAQHLRDAVPKASFIGFTGTPIELEDKSTRAVFGDYVSVYDIQRAVQDGATVPIYYESRLAKLNLKDDLKELLDEEFDEVTEGQEDSSKEKLKSKWAALEAVVGEQKRIKLIAKDLVAHFTARQEAMEGKAMVVCMSRRICVEMYKALTELCPQWAGTADDQGAVKVVMTGSASDKPDFQPHIRNKARLQELAKRFKDPADPFKIVIVRDMWLTGFDAPCLHTMYVDKPMQGHGLMQAIARVNRVFRDKPGGLVVDYLGIADGLQKALAIYTASGGKGETAVDQVEAVAVMLEKLEVCRDIFHGFDYSQFFTGTPTERLKLLPAALNHVFGLENGRDRLVKAVMELGKAFALSVPLDEAMEVRDEVGFFQAVKAAAVKSSVGSVSGGLDMDHAIRQLVSKAITADGVVDVLQMAGLRRPDLSILDETFLAEVRDLPHKNLAVELLRKLLNDELKTRMKKNLTASEGFSAKLEKTIRAYRNRAIQTLEVIEELIGLAKEIKEQQARGVALNLQDDELAFYDALATNESAVREMGDAILTAIAREVTATIRSNVTIDWTQRESVRANLRRLVRRALKKYGYPPDMQDKAVETVMRQAETLAAGWAT